MEMALSGDVTIDAWTAQDWGLVNRVVPASQLDSSVADLLERVTRGSAESKAIGKQALYAQIDLDQPKAYAYAIEVMAATSRPAGREGRHAGVPGQTQAALAPRAAVTAPPHHRRGLSPAPPGHPPPADRPLGHPGG